MNVAKYRVTVKSNYFSTVFVVEMGKENRRYKFQKPKSSILLELNVKEDKKKSIWFEHKERPYICVLFIQFMYMILNFQMINRKRFFFIWSNILLEFSDVVPFMQKLNPSVCLISFGFHPTKCMSKIT